MSMGCFALNMVAGRRTRRVPHVYAISDTAYTHFYDVACALQ